jgi:hypothetical protein
MSPWGKVAKGGKTRAQIQDFQPVHRGSPQRPADEE